MRIKVGLSYVFQHFLGLFFPAGGPQSGYGHYDETYGPPPPHYEGRRMGPPLGRTRGGPRYGGPQYGHGPPPDYAAQADSPVIMVYGLDPFKINADRIFNIFCLYGNVERVSFLLSYLFIYLKPNSTRVF